MCACASGGGCAAHTQRTSRVERASHEPPRAPTCADAPSPPTQHASRGRVGALHVSNDAVSAVHKPRPYAYPTPAHPIRTSDPSSRCPPTPPTPEICSDGCLVAKMPRPSLAQHAPPPIMRRLPHPPATISLHSFQTSISAPPAPEIAHRRTSTTNHCSWQQPPTSRPRALVPLRQGERLGLALGECLLDESLHGR